MTSDAFVEFSGLLAAGRATQRRWLLTIMPTPANTRIKADFNGFLERDLLCLAHTESVLDASGRTVRLSEGMTVTAFASMRMTTAIPIEYW